MLKEVPDSQFERVINTRILIIRKKHGDTYYLHVFDGWLSSSSVNGPWRPVGSTPFGLEDVAKKLAQNGQVDLLDGGRVRGLYPRLPGHGGIAHKT